MDTIEFVIVDNTIRMVINGRDLFDMVREVELPYATKEGSPSIAGNYGGLPAKILSLSPKHFLGEPNRLYGGYKNQTQVGVCGCGEAGCWPLDVAITINDAEVIWSDFSQPHRSENSKTSHWRYDDLGPFHFDRKQYEAALSSIK